MKKEGKSAITLFGNVEIYLYVTFECSLATYQT